MKISKSVVAVMVLAGWAGATGCRTAPVNPLAGQNSPALAGGMQVLETMSVKGQVTGLTPERRVLALRTERGDTIQCRAGAEVGNYSQLRVGDLVEATVTGVVTIYPVKMGAPPAAGAGVELAGQPAGLVLPTTDTRARVFQIDRSYRMLNLDYGNGYRREFKVPMHYKLKDLKRWDEVVVRGTEPLALRVEPR